MSTDALLGVWHLVSFVRLDANGDVAASPKGSDPQGMLVYCADGHMSVHLMNSGRTPFGGVAQEEGTAAEKVEALDTYQGYAGTFELSKGRVTHHVTLSSFPNWVGRSIWRDAELDGDTLTLTARYQGSTGDAQRSVLVWRRGPKVT
ncbi:lipocalin-like domain-containing protein [Amycolatopsis sp. H20-H5]|uniref:lipocalin-like domain-containing protein n=1 Tax=Amycolatopsis sp. H20-H5 TaxID=3046309 RepID=UPI002DBC416D|nr:lipocalin-like domain-containing protein [Amycolatopsis sp. H20-H5]MEC3981342.1 lipocalin-like domain-containing protein [Amycolatopsis sp. H20-H5]